MHKKAFCFVQRNFIKISALFLWLIVFISFYYYKTSNQLSYIDLLQKLYFYIAKHQLGPFVYIAIYSLRPLFFFPSALLTILSGILYGFSGGIIFTLVGENASASSGYLIGRLLSKNKNECTKKTLINKWEKALKEHDFIAVVLMRLIYMPFDLTNFACGWLRVNWTRYTIATFVGIMPSIIIWVGIGDSIENIENFDPSQIQLDYNQLIVSGGLLLVSLGIAKYLHSKRRRILN